MEESEEEPDYLPEHRGIVVELTLDTVEESDIT